MFDIPDETITEYLLARDERALELASAKYSPYIRRIAANMLGGGCDADECVNDVMLALWNAKPDEARGGLSALVACIARRVCANRYNAARSKKRVPSELTEALDDLAFAVPDETADTEREFFAAELAAVINRWLKSLGGTDRFIFISRYYDSEPVSAISERLGVSQSLIYKKLNKLKTKLKNELERNGYTV